MLARVDDATSELVELRFGDADSTFDHARSAKRHVTRYGKPVAFGSAKHAILCVDKRKAAGGSALTRFDRALHDLNIDVIYADSSQCGSRVERLNLTLQHRSVEEPRLRGISAIAAGDKLRIAAQRCRCFRSNVTASSART